MGEKTLLEAKPSNREGARRHPTRLFGVLGRPPRDQNASAKLESRQVSTFVLTRKKFKTPKFTTNARLPVDFFGVLNAGEVWLSVKVKNRQPTRREFWCFEPATCSIEHQVVINFSAGGRLGRDMLN